MRIKLFVVLAIMVLAPLAVVAVVVNTTAQAAERQAQEGIEVVATDLDNPRGLTFGPDGSLFVAEAGQGGSGDCMPNPEGGEDVCYGETGAITRIISPTSTPTQSQVISGLASVAVSSGMGATGPHDLVFDENGQPVIVVGLGQDPAERNGSSQLMNLGQLASATLTGTWTNTVDIAAYEASENPDGGLVDSNPFSIVAVDDGYVVSDAGANALLHISPTGTITTVTVFPTRTVEFPPDSGTMVDVEPVPTGMTIGPDGAYYVGELTDFPFPVGGANVYRVVPGAEPELYADGFTNVIDVDFDADGNLYVLEIATNGLLGGDPTGALIRVTPEGERDTIASTGLFLPTGLEIGPDGAAYVSNFGTFSTLPPPPPPASPDGELPSSGQVWRIPVPPVPEDEFIYYFPFIAYDGDEPPVEEEWAG